MSNEKTIYFDVSDILVFARSNNRLSGIQRVSLEIIKYISEKYKKADLRLICFHPVLKKVVWFSPEPFDTNYVYNHFEFCKYFHIDYREEGALRLRDYLKKRYRSAFKRRYHGLRLRLRNFLDGGQTFARHNIRAKKRTLKISANNAHDTYFKNGDCVFVSGATWEELFDDYLSFLEAERVRLGIKLHQFVHDLIPLIAPEHVVNNMPERFSAWIERMCRIADFFLVNSESTRRDLDQFMRTQIGQITPIQVVPLAHELLLPESPDPLNQSASAKFFDPDRHTFDGQRVRSEVLNAALLPYVLVVGTIESRKNVWTMAIVWQEIRRRLGFKTPILVFAGKQGWAKRAFDDFVQGTGHLDGYIRIVDRPDDFELAYLYKHCLFSVCMSYYEGWGLPIGESLWFGRPVVASNLSSMPEVGGALVEYADPYDPESILDACLKLITDDAHREAMAQRIRREDLRRWSDVAEGIWQALNAPAEGERDQER